MATKEEDDYRVTTLPLMVKTHEMKDRGDTEPRLQFLDTLERYSAPNQTEESSDDEQVLSSSEEDGTDISEESTTWSSL
ncbi:unnamed protein product [Heligmosomoides polygyrus]|uniref:Intraflagellar transport protein 43 homolog n=1 Tax=Heligmosomoides polygyrus TaxID=6339 RepID=A0A183FF61_HELPZ|nr:unnamed protein product [Heligmosomoides polygyrus]